MGPRVIAVKVLADVLAGKSLSDSLPGRVASLGTADQALVAELTYGCCRWYQQLEFIARGLLRKPLKSRDRDVHLLILLGLYQLRHTRVPAHAAVGETAGAARQFGKTWAVSLINGVLRRFQREKDAIISRVSGDEDAQVSMPSWLRERIEQDWSNQSSDMLQQLLQRAPMTLRVNLSRITRDEFLQQLKAEGIDATIHPVVPTAVNLKKPMAVDKIPGFLGGLVSVQDAGAQLAGELLPLDQGDQVLDACAAPGGKTGHLLEKMPGISVSALDVDEQRLDRVRSNLARLRLDAEVICDDAAIPSGDWAKIQYDKILLDAPCSATGVLRRHPDIKLLRRPSDIGGLAARQQELLEAMWRILKPGGKLLYVTCSVLSQENREQISRFIYNHQDATLIHLPSIGLQDEFGDLRIAPGFEGMDGFYYALLEKKG